MKVKKPIIGLILLLLSIPSLSWAVCSTVSIEIPQELTIERVAFDAKMVITNNVPDKDLSNIRVDVTIKDSDGNVKNDLFFLKVSSTKNIDSVDGNGVVRAATTAEIHWLIIPSPGAGGIDSAGVPYWVSATLTYTVDVNEEVVSVNPDRITVKPEAQLILDYFIPYEVIADNPFTPQVEAPVPFPLAVRVLNAGYGAARNLKIDSAQPKIISNDQGLLVSFRLLGASVNDSAVSPSLAVQIGTLDSKKIATAYWEMITTLSGQFIDFSATFSHDSDLGGDLTSLIKETNAYYFIHRVKVNLPGRDSRLDFLADIDEDPEHLPDTIFESEIPGGTGRIEDANSPVTVVPVTSLPARPTSQQPNVEMKVSTGDVGWIYARLPDPSMGLLEVIDVIRSDGVHLDKNNFWVSEGLDSNYQKIYTLHLLDYRADATSNGTYTLAYAKPAVDNIPPVTTLLFEGPSKGTDPIYITPETRIIFKADDNGGGSGVDQMLRKIVGQDANFVPAFPLSITTPGNIQLDYYSIDRAGNQEAVQTAYFFIDNATPNILSFQAVPSTFTPNAPRGVAATKTMNFVVKATDDINSLQLTLDIAPGAEFLETKISKTIGATIVSGVETKIPWDGKDKNGTVVPPGLYAARARVTDGLNGGVTSHTSTSTVQVTVSDWVKDGPFDSNLSGAQMFPKVDNTMVVWQDQRNGNWDIYVKDSAGGSSVAITGDTADQIRPAISGNIIVWQDQRNGNWDIYGYDITTGQEFVVCDDPGNQERPVISGEWVSWQDDRAGNWDIYVYNINTHEKIRITSHERDQMHPAISGNLLVWEDYRYGLGDVYTYDILSGSESRHTVDINNQTLPGVSGNTIAWTDQRNGQRDIYFSGPSYPETRVTYGAGDHSQANVLNDVIVYTDYEAGNDDPNIAFYDIRKCISAELITNPAKQEEPALGTGMVVWQDDRDGIYQIYWASFQVEAPTLKAEIKPGFNLIAVGGRLADTYQNSANLIASALDGIGIEKVITYNSLNGIFLESSPDNSIALRKGIAIGIYASGSGELDIGDSGETAQYTLLPGMNYVGALTVPNGYTAFNLMQSVGLDNIQSVRRFDKQTGFWQTASVREAASGKEAVGVNFVVQQGDGLIIMMKKRVDGWAP